MDFLKRVTDFIGKYRFAALVVMIGVILMLLPTDRDDQPDAPAETPSISQEIAMAEQLEQILTQIKGVGKVEVMLTLEEGERTLYQSDDSGNSNDTVIITDEERAQSALISQVLPEKYRGAIVVCQGADSAAVRLCVIEAVAKVTGLGTDRISVVKMK